MNLLQLITNFSVFNRFYALNSETFDNYVSCDDRMIIGRPDCNMCLTRYVGNTDPHNPNQTLIHVEIEKFDHDRDIITIEDQESVICKSTTDLLFDLSIPDHRREYQRFLLAVTIY